MDDSTLARVFEFLDTKSLIRCLRVSTRWNAVARAPSLWKKSHLALDTNDTKLYRLSSLGDVISLQYLESVCIRAQIDVWRPRSLTDSGVTSFFGKCHSLVSVELLDLVFITNPSLDSLTLNCATTLTSVTLRRCDEVTDAGLYTIALHCHLISHLILEGCYSVTNRGIMFLSDGCPRLEFLSIAQSRNISDEGVVYLARKCTDLKHLDITCYPTRIGLTDRTLAQLALSCKRLVFLNLSGCVAVSDYGITQIASSCSLIQRFVLRNCSQLSDDIIAPLTQLEHLSEINFSGVTGISSEGCALLLSVNPLVKIIPLEVIMRGRRNAYT
ncbi:F-box/LRR-repeat protein 20 [Pelomyxa schiedti]|nr:F-box/LRR-repeat protein 20 [Pelomyxa schiedti]